MKEVLPQDRVPQLKRLKWLVLLLTVGGLTLGVIVYYTLSGSISAYLVTWMVGIIAATVGIELAFSKIISIQEQLGSASEESQLLEKQQTALVSLSERLATASSELEICQTVSQGLQNVLGSEYKVTCLISDQAWENGQPASNPPAEGGSEEVEGRQSGDLTEVAGSSHQPEDTRPYRSSISLPLQIRDKLIGELVVGSELPHSFSEDEKNTFAGVANQVALAIEFVRLSTLRQKSQGDAERRDEELRVQERYLALLSEISRTALKSQDFQSMLQTLTEYLTRLLEADSALILLWDEERNQIIPAAANGPLRQVFRSLPVEPEDIIAFSSVLNSGRTLEVNIAPASPYLSARLAARLQVKSMLALPLVADNRKLGAALLFRRVEHRYPPREISLGEQAASQLALAIAKSRAQDAVTHRTQELAALQKATAALLNTLDLEILLGQILDAAISAISASEKGTLHLVARDTGQLQLRAVQGYTDPRIRTFNPTDSASYAAVAVRERRPLLIQDAETGPHNRPGEDIPEIRAISSMIIAPLILSGRTLGAVSLDSYRRNAFTETDLQLLVTFAATATTAIQNALLYTEVQKQAITDPLTGIYNRRGFFELGRREVERAHRFGRPLSAMMIDIDLFKQINDTQGHLIGDQVLAGVASIIEHELRQVDLPGRYGGDEFIALLPETDLDHAFQAAERLRQSLSRGPYQTENQVVRITASIGLAQLEHSGDSLETLIERADQALYAAKQAGRNQTVQETRN
jgi:diguanylate cyclase (GGDEF)-like protein